MERNQGHENIFSFTFDILQFYCVYLDGMCLETALDLLCFIHLRVCTFLQVSTILSLYLLKCRLLSVFSSLSFQNAYIYVGACHSILHASQLPFHISISLSPPDHTVVDFPGSIIQFANFLFSYLYAQRPSF